MVENSNILDLYSGIGSFGLECISRGAKKVTFVEKDSATIEILKKTQGPQLPLAMGNPLYQMGNMAGVYGSVPVSRLITNGSR